MVSDNSRIPASPRAIPWFWPALSALLIAAAAAVLLQVIAVPTVTRAIVVAVLVLGAIAIDLIVRFRHADGGPQRSYLQIIGSIVPLLVIGTLLTVAAPLPPIPGVVVAVLVGVVAFGALTWGQRNQIRHAKRSAAPHEAGDSTRTAISERGGGHHPVRGDLPGRGDRGSRAGRAGRDDEPVRE